MHMITKERIGEIALIMLCSSFKIEDPQVTHEEFKENFMNDLSEDPDIKLQLESDGITIDEFSDFLDVFYEELSKK